jgi:hypothetical protein
MNKNILLVVAVLTLLVIEGGCAKGGNGIVAPPPSIAVAITSPTNVNNSAIYPTQTFTVTATISNSTSNAVTWSLTGPGTLTPVSPATVPPTAVYVGPNAAGSQPTINAALVGDTAITGSLVLTIVDITTEVTPTPVSVGSGLTQQFTAVAVPDDAPQTFTWTCTAGGNACVNFRQDANISGLAYYRAQDNCTGNCVVQISAASTLDPTGCTPTPKYCTVAKPSIVTSRVDGTYAFQFSGFNAGGATAVAGTFVASDGTITSGVEYETTSGGRVQHTISGGTYTPISAANSNSNNAGTLTLTSGASPSSYQVVLDGDGDIEMIESDGQGTGSGIAQIAAKPSQEFKGDQTYAFGFTGVDSSGKRVGYVGLLPMDGNGNITGGQMDANDNGNDTNICGAGPCPVTGTYTTDGCNCGLYHMTITAGSSAPMSFDFFISSGTTSKTTPLTFYAVTSDTTSPAVSGTMVLQDSSQTYNNAAFNGISVSALTGVNGANSNVALSLGTTDGSGNIKGQFDQNNAGTIVAVPPISSSACKSPTICSFAYTYTATGSNAGRYTIQMLGNPNASLAPLPFILYASGANRGFLLDQSSTSVMTGTMNPQGSGSGSFAASELPGTYGAATTSSATAGVTPIAANLLATSPGSGTYNITGTQYPGSQAITGLYTLDLNSGRGTFALTAPGTETYAFYVLDTSGCTKNSGPVCSVEDFYMIDETTTNTTPSVIFAKE